MTCKEWHPDCEARPSVTALQQGIVSHIIIILIQPNFCFYKNNNNNYIKSNIFLKFACFPTTRRHLKEWKLNDWYPCNGVRMLFTMNTGQAGLKNL